MRTLLLLLALLTSYDLSVSSVQKGGTVLSSKHRILNRCLDNIFNLQLGICLASLLVPDTTAVARSEPLPHIIGDRESTGIIITGYQIPPLAYESWYQLVSHVCSETIVVGDALLSSKQNGITAADNSIDGATTRLLNSIFDEASILKHKQDNLLLLGHSRGGAIALNAAIRLISAKQVDQARTPKALILIDPVDESSLPTIKAIRDIIPPRDRVTNKLPVYLISTPYGGQSAYYKSSYASACSPPERSSDAFLRAMQGCPEFFDVKYEQLSSIGHLQLLDPALMKSEVPFASICAGNSDLSFVEQTKLTTQKHVSQFLQSVLLKD